MNHIRVLQNQEKFGLLVLIGIKYLFVSIISKKFQVHSNGKWLFIKFWINDLDSTKIWEISVSTPKLKSNLHYNFNFKSYYLPVYSNIYFPKFFLLGDSFFSKLSLYLFALFYTLFTDLFSFFIVNIDEKSETVFTISSINCRQFRHHNRQRLTLPP